MRRIDAAPAATAASSRRAFLSRGAQSTAAGLLGSSLLATTAHAAGSDVVRVGLIGCGGRGTGAALNATHAGPDVRIVALADLFPERLDEAKLALTQQAPSQVDLPADRCFAGFDAYQRLIDCGVDVVLITPASHFTPSILSAAVDAGKHVFCEKPHAIDIPGLEVTRAACERARQSKLNLVSGLCWRYDLAVREAMLRIHDGQIGEVLAIQSTYVSQPYVARPRRPGQSELEYQLWNWYHFNWLSGDQTAQQLIHSLDKASWALGDRPPLRAWGMGGRQTCLDPLYGDQFDHQAVVFEYPDGVRVYGLTRDQEDCHRETSDYLIGSKGRCDLLSFQIEGTTNWQYQGERPSMYDVEHAELFEAIRQGHAIDDSRHMILSSALGIMAQAACYSGQMVEWDALMRSTRSFSLPRYGWDVEAPVQPGPDGRYPTALPGGAELKRWLQA